MKLIVEISDDLYNVIKTDKYGLHKGKMYDIIRDGIPLNENKGGWIPITKETELPKHDVICCNDKGDIALGYLYFDEEENQIACDHDPYVMFGIVAYMENPEPYKAESE